ncbi:type III PLP-dependent enzyme [Mycolicibacterium sp.]|uniref:type III PLP-dependent enzyme n=1 Tax=Mycolicibacterium sp. TaxID=2320850 RepID=UPI001A2A1CC6|nr:type III PLP-dependent enzyme [Mycolicibacterium sp.]MBJ7337847.1 type III PLP-dependent enzyme [Mycolicibacterium sp.]
MNPRRRSQLRRELARCAPRWRELAATYGTPLLVLDPYRVAAQYSLLTEHLRGFGLHYAVKALPHPAVLTVLAASGSGFDLATSAEVDLLATLGVPMDRCIYTHPVKKPADIDHAYAAGIRTFVVDNPIETQKFVGRDPEIEILVRLAFPNPTAKSDLSIKFGTDPAEAELLVKHVLAAGVRFAGFSFHVGSQGSSVRPYREALRATLELTGHVERTLGVRATTIDIGGGFPISYRDEMPSIGEVGTIVDEVLGRHHGFTMLAEPGRFVVADCMTLLSSVVGSAVRAGRTWHYLDDGRYGSYSNVMTEDVHPPILALSELGGDDDQTPTLEPVTLAGPTCDSADVVATDYPMPRLAVGDVVVSPTMGAYTSVTASRFNGIAETPILVATHRG